MMISSRKIPNLSVGDPTDVFNVSFFSQRGFATPLHSCTNGSLGFLSS